MKTTRSSKKASVAFCCIKLYRETCEKELPRIRLLMERDGNIRLSSNGTIFKFCPFCGKVIRTTIIFDNKKIRVLP